jgi:hypothetical protein
MANAIELTFMRDTAPPKRKGPYRLLRFEGEVIRPEPGGPVLARHERHEWEVDGQRFSRLQLDCRAVVHFERIDGGRSRTFGPYNCVSFIDGVAYVDHHIFAFVDRTMVDWYCHEDEKHWPLMIIRPAEELTPP